MKLMLFGSRATNSSRPDSDIDVVIVDGPENEKAIERIKKELFKYSVERGGKLDLFVDDGMDFWAAFDGLFNRRIELGTSKHGKETCEEIMRTWKEVTLEEVKRMCENG